MALACNACQEDRSVRTLVKECKALSFLQAYEWGAEVIITIDDDNYFVPGQDFIGEHVAPILGATHTLLSPGVTRRAKWLFAHASP